VKRPRAFVAVWTLAIAAAVFAFTLHLALRAKTLALGYELGRSHAEQSRLREVQRVLQVEAASYKTPERVEVVARTLLGMETPGPDRIIGLPAIESRDDDESTGNQGASAETPATGSSALAQEHAP
jgi:cell division protein FtsL